ncbi:Epsin-1 [Fasciolopsis buskii]|uniref:Epsin-1 n=1 Tax=Fasciolopsis buskii TaxID=27845 RepID=A0A8E0RWW6_9TREM|nr:Epsin-1 [Fasciolopsis buski]
MTNILCITLVRKAIQRKIKSAIRGYSRVEELVRKATCSDPWGPSSTELLQIAQCASSFTDTEQIMRVLWKRLLAGGRNWLYVYKTLVVFEYLIKYGVDTVIEQCQSNRVYLATFLRYDSVQPNLSRRQVSLIRDRAQSILHLLSDSQHRMEEQERLHETIGGLNDIPDCKCPYLMFLYYYYYTH